MRKTFLSVLVATAGLVGACAGREVRDEGLLRIDEVMRPDTKPPPEGIELGLDAPPLAPPDRDVLWAPVYAFPGRLPGPYPYCPHGPLGPPASPPPQGQIRPQPGGSIPGLLP